MGELCQRFGMTLAELEEIGIENVDAMLVIQNELHAAEREELEDKERQW